MEEISTTKKRLIWYFAILFSIIPILDFSGLTMLLNKNIPLLAGNYNLIILFLSIPLIRKIKDYKGLKYPIYALYILVVYIVFKFISSVNETSFYLTLQVFRRSFMGPINLVVLLPFVLNLDREELRYLWRVLFKITVVFGLVYLSNNMGFTWINVSDVPSQESHGGYTVERSIIGLPPIENIWLPLAIASYCIGARKSTKWLLFFFVLLFLSFTRNLLLSAVICIAIISFLIAQKNLLNVGKLFKLMSFFFLAFGILYIVFPTGAGFWISKMINTINEDLANDTGTFAFRERLIESASELIKFNPLLGLGYVKDAPKDSYSIVMSGDTYYAAVLYAEGYIGIILRSLCYIILLFICMNHYLKYKLKYVLPDIIIISAITAFIVNYVQTKMFTHYLLFFGMLLILWLIQWHDKKDNYHDVSNYLID